MKYRYLLLFIFLVGLSRAAQAAPPPASCQKFLLFGKIEVPPDFPENIPVELNLTYQMNYQKFPALLLVNYPLDKREFIIFFAPSPVIIPDKKEKPKARPESAPESQAYLSPKMFLYPREIRFQYFARTHDGRWQSAYLTTTYVHEKKQVEGKWECEGEVDLTPLALKAP